MTIKQGKWEGPPILRYPVLKGTHFHHSQGWGYQGRELDIHGKKDHPAADIAAERGTKLFSPLSGYGFCSFQQTKLRDDAGELILHEDKFICYSLGRFWQIYVPEYKIYVMLAHFHTLRQHVNFFVEPIHKADGEYYPTTLQDPPDLMMKRARPIEQGMLLGTMGVSGLGWGYIEAPSSDSSPDPTSLPTWDPVGSHVHIEVFTRDEKGEKDVRYDPFGLYSSDLTLYEKFTLGGLDKIPDENMWELDENNRPLYAD